MAPDLSAIRQTVRFRWIDHALAPLQGRLAPDPLARLRSALALMIGAEALIVTRDVCLPLDTDERRSCAGLRPAWSAPR